MRGKAFAACRATLKSRCSWASGGESCGCCQQSWRPLRQSRTRKLLQRPTCRSRLRCLRRHHSRTTEAGSISAATLDICGAAHGLKKTGWSPSRTRRRTASLAACWLVTTGKPALGSSALKETSAGPMHTGPARPRPRSPCQNAYDVNWTGHVRGRLGYAFNTWLFFIAGGFAVADFNFQEGEVIAPIPSGGRYNGWSIGGGVEVAILRNLIGVPVRRLWEQGLRRNG